MKKGSQQMMNTPGGQHGGQAGPEAGVGAAGKAGTHGAAGCVLQRLARARGRGLSPGLASTPPHPA